MEKIVQQQKYQKARKQYQKTQPIDDYKQRSKRTRDNLIASMQAMQNPRKYNLLEGLIFYWDWTMNLPKKYEKSQLTFGIFKKGETLLAPKTLNDCVTRQLNYNSNICHYYDRDHIYDIKSD